MTRFNPGDKVMWDWKNESAIHLPYQQKDSLPCPLEVEVISLSEYAPCGEFKSETPIFHPSLNGFDESSYVAARHNHHWYLAMTSSLTLCKNQFVKMRRVNVTVDNIEKGFPV